jgi:hypothetical protein
MHSIPWQHPWLLEHGKRKKTRSAAIVRDWLDGAGRRVTSSARKRRRSCPVIAARSPIPSPLTKGQTGANVALIGNAGQRRQPPLDLAEDAEIIESVKHRSSSRAAPANASDLG